MALSSVPAQPPSLGKLRQLCRRGTQELDVLLERWLENHYHNADAHTLDLLVRLLAFEDDVLQDLLVYGRKADAEFVELIESIQRPSSATGGRA